MSRCFRQLTIACLVYMTLVLEAVAMPRIWVALAEEGGPHAEFAATLRAELGRTFDLHVARWGVLVAPRDEPPDLIVTVGVPALDGVLEHLGRRGEAWGRVPVLAALVPQAVFEARQADSRIGRRPFSAALLDQPLARQLALIERALPEHRRVGVLAGPRTRPLSVALGKEALARDLELRLSRPVDATEDIYPALRQAIEESDIILAFPDPVIYNSANLQHILLTTYRARIPLAAFSPAYVRAGAVLAIYSTPAQVARRSAEMLRRWRADGSLPPPQRPREFEVAVNERVAASLGIGIDAADLIAADLRRQETDR